MLKRTKFNFRWGFAPDPAGELTALPDLLAGFKGPTYKGREDKGAENKGKGKGREEDGREGEGREEKGG